MNNKKFKFSVIIPIYNVEDYLEETIESVINQTIGFKDNIELILVNDGSPDNSESVCLKYKELYPDNVKYIKKENGGVSSARNEGLKHVEGQFVNFLDSDDKWSPSSFETVYHFYTENPDIGIFSTKMCFFDGRKGNHPLNYKYRTNKIINILEDYAYPQLSSSSLFIRSDLVKGHKYEEHIKFSEDNRFINEIILKEQKYMVLKTPTYYYRRRSDVSSAIQNQVKNETYYTITPKDVYAYLFDYSKKIYGEVIPYIQYLVMYDLSYRIESPKENPYITKEYIDIYTKLVKQMDDEIILTHRHLDLAKRLFVLKLKYGEEYAKKIKTLPDRISIKNHEISNKNLGILIIDNVVFRDKKAILYGKLDTNIVPSSKFKILLDDEEIKPSFYELANDYDENTFNGDSLYKYKGIEIELPTNKNYKVSFYYRKLLIIPRFKRASYFNEGMPYSYHNYLNKTFYYHKDHLYCASKNIFRNGLFELRIQHYLFNHGKKASALIRAHIKLDRFFKFKKIMLVSDRLDKADDNGEHFFKYMIENHKEIKTYFVLSHKSPDYERLSKIGPVLDNNSRKYKLYFQVCDYIVSSQGENYVFDILGNNSKFVHDQYYFKYIFLQHGIIKDDLSPWLNINSKKMDMFVTSCPKEYQSLLDCNYHFGKEVVKLTGLPRFDTLLEKQKTINPQKQILMSFTWRNALTSKINSKTGKRLYNEEFKESDYFKNINNLLNDKRLLKVLKEKGYKIRFLPHPNLMAQLEDFTINEFIDINNETIDYQKEFCQSSLLVTDYSSVFFDFAYLNKPVVYYQYDEEEFYKTQIYNQGYFNYTKDGFGPVCHDYDSLVESIIKIIENDCKLEEKYQKRINEFYKYHDQKNSERVYNEIMKL